MLQRLRWDATQQWAMRMALASRNELCCRRVTDSEDDDDVATVTQLEIQQSEH